MTLVARCHHAGITDLASDLVDVVRKTPGEMRRVVREGAIVGNTVARDNARRTARRHGKHYPGAFTWEMKDDIDGAAAEYGPDAARKQGDMEFEDGSQNQPPHRDLAKSARLIGPTLGEETRRMVGRLLW